MKSSLTTAFTILILFSAIYCRAGLFDKLNQAINTANPFANTNAPVQETATNQPVQNNAVETQQSLSAVAVSQTNSLESQSEQITNTSQQNTKAYKTLNFGDNYDTVDHKLADILGVPEQEIQEGNATGPVETFWRSLFDTDAEYEPYKENVEIESQSDKFESLMLYFGRLNLNSLSLGNSAISINCYELYYTVSQGGSLAVVEVSYKTFDLDKLVADFMQNYPNAKKYNKPYRIESTMYPGVFLEFERTYLSDINPYRRATLSIPTNKFNFTFTEPSKLSSDQLTVWQGLMTQNNQTNMDEYFESVKTSFLGFVPDKTSVNPLDPLTYQGWYYSGEYSSEIYGAPNAVFASKQILDPLMNNYRQSIEAADQEQKAKLKKDSDSSTGF